MPSHRHIVCLFASLAAVGCATPAPHLANPSPFAAVEYDRVFDAAVAELRDRGFDVERDDRRQGVVTTRHRYASTALEPWRREDTQGRTLQSTLNSDRRTVVVELEPLDDPSRFELAVTVQIERRQTPPKQLTSSVLGQGRIAGRGRDRARRSIRTEEGLETLTWKPVGRDDHMERSLLDAILSRAAPN